MHNNKGFTLIELILTMAISAIVITCITAFMGSSIRSFVNADSEINLQSEAQTIMNTVTDYAMQGDNVYYNRLDHTLTIYHINSNTNTIKEKEIFWHNNNKLYLFCVPTQVSDANVTLIRNTLSGSEDYLLGDYVTGFSSSQTKVDGMDTSLFDISLKLEYNGKSYELTNHVKLRNKIIKIP